MSPPHLPEYSSWTHNSTDLPQIAFLFLKPITEEEKKPKIDFRKLSMLIKIKTFKSHKSRPFLRIQRLHNVVEIIILSTQGRQNVLEKLEQKGIKIGRQVCGKKGGVAHDLNHKL